MIRTMILWFMADFTFWFTKSVIMDAHFCNDWILVMQSVDGCSMVSQTSMDPCEVPDAGELWLPKLPIGRLLHVPAPIIGIGALNTLVLDAPGELPNLHGKLHGRDRLVDDDGNSSGGPGTRTYSWSTNSNESTMLGSMHIKQEKVISKS